MKFSATERNYWPTEEWRITDAASVGMRAEKLLEADVALDARYKTINGIVVVRRGAIVFERYRNGYKPGDTHNVASVTKSVISALIGIAIDSGYIQNVDQKILGFFPEYVPAPGDLQKRALSIRHLLTMTAPIAWQSGAMGIEPLNRLRRPRDWVTFILNMLGENGQLGKFQYTSVGAHLLSAIISRTTGLCAREFANRFLFKPLGMKEIPDYEMKSFALDDVFGKNVTGWIKDPSGITTGGWGLTITPRDMARFGFLYLNGGKWDGRQVISEEWIIESIAQNSNRYGYFWWLSEESKLFRFTASGSGGSHICCLPSLDLVVSIASKVTMKARDRWGLFEDCILPAVVD